MLHRPTNEGFARSSIAFPDEGWCRKGRLLSSIEVFLARISGYSAAPPSDVKIREQYIDLHVGENQQDDQSGQQAAEQLGWP
jgi:hypothetical protein